jgi:hypothetical protein
MVPQQSPTSKDDAQAGLKPYVILTQKPGKCLLREPLTRYIDQTIEDLSADGGGDCTDDEDCKLGQW